MHGSISHDTVIEVFICMRVFSHDTVFEIYICMGVFSHDTVIEVFICMGVFPMTQSLRYLYAWEYFP